MLNYYTISNASKIKNKIEWSNVRKGYHSVEQSYWIILILCRHQKFQNLYSVLIEFSLIFENTCTWKNMKFCWISAKYEEVQATFLNIDTGVENRWLETFVSYLWLERPNGFFFRKFMHSFSSLKEVDLASIIITLYAWLKYWKRGVFNLQVELVHILIFYSQAKA